MGYMGKKKKFTLPLFSTTHENFPYIFLTFYMNIEMKKILHVHIYIVSETEKKSPLPPMST